MRSLLVPRRHSRAAVILLCLSALYSCGGGDSVAPPEPFPDVTGSYHLDGGFDGLTRGEASFSGTLTLTQASRQSGTLGGTVSITATIDGQTSGGGTAPLQSASVSPTGAVSFSIGSITAGGSWTFSGTHAGTTISGRHTLTDGTSSFSGNWSGTSGSTANGSITVTSSTIGSSLDPDGYGLAVDGLDGGSLGVNASVRFDGLVPGSHTIGLDGVATNCQVQGENLRAVTVSPGANATVVYNVTCATPPASTGTLRVTTATSGSQLDPDGYLFSVDGGTSQTIGVSETATLVSVAAGPHTVSLTDVAGNCAVQGNDQQSVSVLTGVTTDVTFVVTCSQTVASTTTTIMDDSPDPSSPNEPVTVRFTVTSDGGMPPGIVVVTASGGNATCAVTLTEGQGSCQLTDLSVRGVRVLTATYQGDTQFASSSGQALHTVN